MHVGNTGLVCWGDRNHLCSQSGEVGACCVCSRLGEVGACYASLQKVEKMGVCCASIRQGGWKPAVLTLGWGDGSSFGILSMISWHQVSESGACSALRRFGKLGVCCPHFK